jgi:hypothetical protein
MSSATAMPSSEALCASIGPRTQSPTAQTPGAEVREFSSTSIWPRSVRAHAGVVRQQAFGMGLAADADQQPVEAHPGSSPSAFVFDRDLDLLLS